MKIVYLILFSYQSMKRLNNKKKQKLKFNKMWKIRENIHDRHLISTCVCVCVCVHSYEYNLWLILIISQDIVIEY